MSVYRFKGSPPAPTAVERDSGLCVLPNIPPRQLSKYCAWRAELYGAGIFVAFEETSHRIVANAASFGWKHAELRGEKLFFMDARYAGKRNVPTV